MKKRQDDLGAVRAAIENGGAMTIYKTLMSISWDPTTPAQARVGACATIVRMSGLFEEAKRKPADDAEGFSFTPEQLARLVPMLEAEQDELDGKIAAKRAWLDANPANDDYAADENDDEAVSTDVFE